MLSTFLVVAVLLFLLLVIGTPVAFAMLIAGAAGIYMAAGFDTMLGVLRQTPYEHISSYTMSALPMFVLMAEFLTVGRFTRDIFNIFYRWAGHIRGGLAYATVLGGAVLGAVSGSSTASAGTLASAAFPEMRRFGYDDSFSTGTMAIAGTLAIMIPPSIALVLYGITTESSVGALLLAGAIPGLLTALGYVTAVKVTLIRNPHYAPEVSEKFSMSERMTALREIWPIVLLMFLLLVGIYSGAATVTEIGAVAALSSLVIAVVLGRMTFERFTTAVIRGTRNSAMILIVISTATVFGVFVTLTGVPQTLIQLVEGAGFDRWTVLALVVTVILLMGFFIDQLAIIVLVVPIIFPLLVRLDFDPVWFGVVFVKTAEIGLVTPPMGLNCFVVSGVTGVPVHRVFRGIWWLVFFDITVLIILILFPDISLLVPRLAGLVQ